MHLADASVGIIGESAIVGGGIPLATGVALAARVQRRDQVCLCFFGDGAVNQGTFHESLNMGSLWKLPVIYFCENNGYALTTAVSASHAQPSIARRASAYGLPGVEVDGQDVEAVLAVTRKAAARAREGLGPTLIEAKTYRFDEHEVGLVVPGAPYRSADEVARQVSERDPIELYREKLVKRRVATARLRAVEEEVGGAVAEAIRFARDSAFPKPETLHEYAYVPRVGLDVTGQPHGS
jgi:pyruvate dehydrogenase E1 component alpha subunit